MTEGEFSLCIDQQQQHTFDFSRALRSDDSLARFEVELTPDDGGCLATGAILNSEQALLTLLGVSGEQTYRIEVLVESEARRALRMCFIVHQLESPPPSPIRFYLRPSELVVYQLDYSCRLLPDEHLVSYTQSVEPDDVYFKLAFNNDDELLMSLGLSDSPDESLYTLNMSATTNTGRTFHDTIEIIVGGCNG